MLGEIILDVEVAMFAVSILFEELSGRPRWIEDSRLTKIFHILDITIISSAQKMLTKINLCNV